MLGLLTAVHLLIAVVLIMIVLLQSARGTDVGSAFGGMGSQAAFGPRGTATFLSKATVVLAGVFMISSVTLSIMASRSGGVGGESVLSGEGSAPGAPAPAPAVPAAPAPAGTEVPGVQVQPTPPIAPPDIQITPQGAAPKTPAPAGAAPAKPTTLPAQPAEPAPPSGAAVPSPAPATPGR
jgi:preprotein translocase subunit SecG